MSEESEDGAVEPLSGKILKGSVWSVFLRWTTRGMGLVSTAILARLLMPEDFGLVAMAVAVAGLAQVLLEFGVDMLVIRNPDADDDDFDTAWTFRIFQSCLVTTLLILASGAVASFYERDEIQFILVVVGFSILVEGFRNIGVLKFRKEFAFHKDFQFEVVGKVARVIFAICLALWLRDYRAIVYSTFLGALFSTAYSYVICDYRPRFTLIRAAQTWGFSKWALVRALGIYLFNGADKLVLGKLSSATSLGYYTVASSLSVIAIVEVASSSNRSLVPGFAQLQKAPERLRAGLPKAFGAVMLLALPATVGLALVAHEFVFVVLGEKWLDATSLIQLFAFLALLQAATSTLGNTVVVLGGIRFDAIVSGVKGLALMGAMAILLVPYGIIAVIVAKILLEGCGVVFFAAKVRSMAGVGYSSLARVTWRPLLAASAMVPVLLFLRETISFAPFWQLLVMVVGGGASYVAILLVSWWASGMPDGLESMIFSRLRREAR